MNRKKHYMAHGAALMLTALMLSCAQNAQDKGNAQLCDTPTMPAQETAAAAPAIADSVKLLYDYSDDAATSFKYTFLEFGSKGCLPCKKMEAVMDSVRNEFPDKVNVRFINLIHKESRAWAEHFGIEVIPTQVILDNTGKEVFRHTGYIPAEELKPVFK